MATLGMRVEKINNPADTTCVEDQERPETWSRERERVRQCYTTKSKE